MTYLLDINVLIALFDASHLHHEAAHRWFGQVGSRSWATCPITENGFVRIVSNPAYPTVSITPSVAASYLHRAQQEAGHHFWPYDISLVDAPAINLAHLQGHRQVTDSYLLALAANHRGKLATFDTKISSKILLQAKQDAIELLSP